MLTRLIVHSWYTLGSYMLHPGRVTLIDPAPALDPTDPIDILEIVRDYVVEGRMATKMFPRRSLPVSRHFSQDFELELRGPDGAFKYDLLIEQDRRRADGCRSELETLWHDDACVAMYQRGRRSPAGPDDDDWGVDGDGQPGLVDARLSAVAQLDADADPRVAAFKRQLARIRVVHTLPGFDPETREARALADLEAARPLLRDPELTLAVVLPNELSDAALEPFLADAHAAQKHERGAQLLLSSPRPYLLERFRDLAQKPGQP